MSNINKRLSELNPHVLGIRFNENITVIDTFFKEGWELPKSEDVGYESVPSRNNTYMLYPQNENVLIDDMLDYVAYTIKINIEREEKIKLLQIKINEMKDIFTRESLSKCKTLEFTFSESPIDYNSDFKLPLENKESNVNKKNVVTEKDLEEVPLAEVPKNDPEVENFNKQARNKKIDLPTKEDLKKIKPELSTFKEPKVVCKCNPNNPDEMCPECMDEKY